MPHMAHSAYPSCAHSSLSSTTCFIFCQLCQLLFLSAGAATHSIFSTCGLLYLPSAVASPSYFHFFYNIFYALCPHLFLPMPPLVPCCSYYFLPYAESIILSSYSFFPPCYSVLWPQHIPVAGHLYFLLEHAWLGTEVCSRSGVGL